ncbi:hypothetical protein [Dulcicalothrix desertica]|nr:hypothetical protein [Dulcicalothrix desertica]TWH38967.1 hypothetical protein CAL7102_08170 [Dulcicalothrix desertica PCC 7102]
MVDNPLVKKLRIKSGQRMIVINSPPGYMEQLILPEGVELAKELEGQFDFIHIFVKNISELESFASKAISALKYDGILWIAYPKQSSKMITDINRDVGWDVIDKAGLKGVAQISINHVWSALRFRPYELVVK